MRRAEKKKRIEAANRAQEEASAKVRRAQDAIRKAEDDRLAALKEAEDARREAEAARAEQQRLAKLAAEPAQKSTVVAALPPGGKETAALTGKSSADTSTDQVKLVRAMQTELKRVGCDAGEVDGVWSAKVKTALDEFVRLAKVTVPSEAPSLEALRAVLGQKGRIYPGSSEKRRQMVVNRPKGGEEKPRRPGTTARQVGGRPCSFGFWKAGDECVTASGKTCIVTGIVLGKIQKRCN